MNKPTNKSFGRFYRIWKGIGSRCNNKKASGYQYYGEVGIKRSKRWDNFRLFKDDMYDSYLLCLKKYGDATIERINNNSGYNNNNCRWIPKNQQSRNKRNNNYFTYRGRTLSLAEWAKELNINYWLLRQRVINKRGGYMTLEEAVNKPARDRIRKVAQKTMDGKIIKIWDSIKEASSQLKIQESGIIRTAQKSMSHSGGFKWEYVKTQSE